jgi:hypothetical protein
VRNWLEGARLAFDLMSITEISSLLKVYAAGSEDMDTLTFNAPILLRHLTFSEAKKMPISEIHLDTALKELDMTMDRVSSEPLSLLEGRLAD